MKLSLVRRNSRRTYAVSTFK